MTHENWNSNYMTYLTKLILIVSVMSCSSSSSYNKLDYIVKKEYKLNLQDFEMLIVLEENTCIACNKAYSQMIELNMRDSVLLVVAATGAQYKIDQFRELEKGKVVFDYSNKIAKNNILKTSGAIILKENRIDTIITINNPNSLAEKMQFVEEQLLRTN